MEKRFLIEKKNNCWAEIKFLNLNWMTLKSFWISLFSWFNSDILIFSLNFPSVFSSCQIFSIVNRFKLLWMENFWAFVQEFSRQVFKKIISYFFAQSFFVKTCFGSAKDFYLWLKINAWEQVTNFFCIKLPLVKPQEWITIRLSWIAWPPFFWIFRHWPLITFPLNNLS